MPSPSDRLFQDRVLTLKRQAKRPTLCEKVGLRGFAWRRITPSHRANLLTGGIIDHLRRIASDYFQAQKSGWGFQPLALLY
jgi:hypothetical protein